MTHPAIESAMAALGLTPETWARMQETHKRNTALINRLASEIRQEREQKERGE